MPLIAIARIYLDHFVLILVPQSKFAIGHSNFFKDRLPVAPIERNFISFVVTPTFNIDKIARPVAINMAQQTMIHEKMIHIY
jgi:hypothetical protein